ncbi:leucine-rich repeat domain-containing protein [Singulisphaera sp. Ch08]|uniref:Leucine-rich repeat domain-containing protein n=1 Tax=Singulisphaera sp. Ch08 TaxID=3120278 RepID=A0AAU7CJZ4_9BACT
MNETLSAPSSIVSLIGFPLSLYQWWQANRDSSKAAEKQNVDETITDYLEWLRRTNHKTLVDRLEASRDEMQLLRHLLEKLQSQSMEQTNSILLYLAKFDSNLIGKIDSLALKIDQMVSQSATFPRLMPPQDTHTAEFEKDYLNFVRKEYDRLKLIGVRMRDIPLKTRIAFVSLNVRQDVESEPTPAEEVLLATPALTIKGPAGSGKSTLLRWIALQCTETETEDNPWRHGIPFFIPLRILVGHEKGKPQPSQFAAYTLRPADYPLSVPAGWVNNVLSQKRGILLIDGVDELPPSQRPAFWEWLKDFTENYPDNRIYISSRPFRNEDTAFELWGPPNHFQQCELEELDEKAIGDLIDNWHEAIEKSLTEEEQIRILRLERERLPRRLKEPVNRRVRDLCRNPLLCALVCALNWQEEGDLPQKRVSLYELCCDLLIETRDKRREIKTAEHGLEFLTKDDKKLVLQRLAWDMMYNQIGNTSDGQQIEVAKEDALKWAKIHINNFEFPQARDVRAEQLLDYLLDRTNLLREPSRGRIDFPHRTFQEYLAACAAGALNQFGIVNNAGNDQWHETIVLAAGTSEGGIPYGHTLIDKLLTKGEGEKSKRVRAACFVLALACCDTAKQVDPKLKERVLKHLGEITPPSDFSIAGVLATAGDSVIPHLEYGKIKRRPAKIVAACARTLAIIGTDAAIRKLSDQQGYGGDDRATVIQEVCECPGIQPLELRHVRENHSVTAQNLFFNALDNESSPPSQRTLSSINQVSFINSKLTHNRTQLLSKLFNLKTLDLRYSYISSIAPLSSLSNLEFLNLDQTNVSDISPLANLLSLEVLSLRNTNVSDLNPISKLINLKYLDIIGTEVSDIAPIEELVHLRELEIGSSYDNFSVLKKLGNLEILTLRGNAEFDTGPLLSLPLLRRLDLHCEKLSSKFVDMLKAQLPNCKIKNYSRP